MTNEAGLEFAKDNAMPTPMTIEMEADERQAALASLKREYELNGSNPCNWFIRDYYDILCAALQSPRVPVWPNYNIIDRVITNVFGEGEQFEMIDRGNLQALIARAYAELQKGKSNG